MRSSMLVLAIVAGALVAAGSSAQAACVTKAAQATAATEKSAKWYALETMVQAVSWSLWPSFLATGKVPGYAIRNQRYKCRPAGALVTCRGQATFCKTA